MLVKYRIIEFKGTKNYGNYIQVYTKIGKKIERSIYGRPFC